VTQLNFIQTTRQAEDALPLKNEQCRSRFLLHPTATPKVFLFFHGITAAPYQFDQLGQSLFQSGHNVLVPLLPGHGQAGDWGKENPPPLPEDIGIYQEFVLQWLGRAQELGRQVIVGGLSAGGVLAAWLAIDHASRVDRALLFAPYLSNSTILVDLISNSSQGYFAWQDAAGRERAGYPGFRFPALKVFPNLGRELLQRAGTQATAPMFILSTATDAAVKNDDHKALFEQVRSRQPLSWYYCFPPAMAVPHAMMAPEEGNRWTSAMNPMVRAYVGSQLSWVEVEEIAFRMSDGRMFNDVVVELGLAAKCGPDMPAMLTMVDKRQIAIDRNGGSDWG
jgi:carboxylesterase